MRFIAVVALALAPLLAAPPASASGAETACETVEGFVPSALHWLERYARGEAPARREQVQADLQRLVARCRISGISRDELLRLAGILELAAGLAPRDDKRHPFDPYALGYGAVLLREAADGAAPDGAP